MILFIFQQIPLLCVDDLLKGGHGRRDINRDAATAVQEDLLFGAVAVELRKGFEMCCRKKNSIGLRDWIRWEKKYLMLA